MNKIKLKYFLLMLFINLNFIYAQDGGIMSSYVSRHWTTDEGLCTNSITTLIQDHFGYIYIGSYVGLIKFDGAEFSIINKNTSNLVHFISARVVFEDSKNRLWVGTNDNGIGVLNENRSQINNISDKIPNKSIRSIVENINGDIWIGTSDGVCVYTNDGTVKQMSQLEYEGLRDSTVVRMFCDKFGVVWVTTSAGNVYRYSNEDKKFKIYKPHFLKNVSVSSVFEDSTGYVWFGLRNNSVVRIKSSELFLDDAHLNIQTYVGKSGIISQSEVNDFMEDEQKNIWVATDVGVIFIGYDGNVKYYTEDEGLINNNVSKILKDREDNIWICSNQGGIQKLTQVRFKSIPTSTSVNCITEEQGKGRYWIGTDGGLLCYRKSFEENYATEYCDKKRIRHLGWCKDGTLLVSTYSDDGQILIKDGVIKSISTKNGLSNNRSRVVVELSDGRLAVGTAKGLNLITYHTTDGDLNSLVIDKIKVYSKIDGLSNDFIMALHEDDQGLLWVGTDGGGVNILNKDGDIIKIINMEDGLPGDVIFKIQQDKNKIYWINTGSGISRYDRNDESFFSYNMSVGLPSDNIFQILFDKSDIAWLIASGGLSSVNVSQLEELATGKKVNLEIKQYNKSDGLFPGGVTSTSLSCIDSRGCLWFPMVNGFSFYNPYQINKANAPLVYINEINTDKKSYAPYETNIEIPANTDRITIKYSGLSFVSLERTAFRYQLIGFDKKPSVLTSQRQATYTNLKSGKYTFEVSVVNGDGIWSTEPARISFVKKVYFYQTVWFWLVIAIVIGGIGILYFRVRMKMMARRQKMLEKIVDEKTQELQLEVGKSENLLLNILPRPIAEQLKDNEEVIADSFPAVSVLFADIVGFTEKSSRFTPKELVLWLNDLFSKFDLRATFMGVEKIKTIGDAYMVACGVPEADENHAMNILNFARGMLKDIQDFNAIADVKVGMRIGISSGAVTAGVIGKTKFIYDIWGDTVNVASRMEYYGKESTITVSETTYQLIKDHCQLIETESIEVKGKGVMQIYRIE